MRSLSTFPLSEIGDLVDDVRRLFDEIDRAHPVPRRALGDCLPTLDVVETDSAFTIVLDVPGVSAAAIRVVAKGNTIVIAGDKQPPAVADRTHASFHLVERGFGRFARAVRLTGAFDASRAAATLVAGELRITLPKIAERRGRAVPIQIQP